MAATQPALEALPARLVWLAHRAACTAFTAGVAAWPTGAACNGPNDCNPVTACSRALLVSRLQPGACRAHRRRYKSRLQVPDLVELYQRGETLLDKYITHSMKFDGAPSRCARCTRCGCSAGIAAAARWPAALLLGRRCMR